MASGTLSIGGIIPPGSIGDNHFSNQPADVLKVDKVSPVFAPECNFGGAIGATPTTKEEIKYTGKIGGTIRGFHAYLNACGSATSITFDLKKNGSTILTSVITITNATGNGVIVSTTSFTSNLFSAGDIFSYSMAVTSSTGAQGANCWAVFVENTAPLT